MTAGLPGAPSLTAGGLPATRAQPAVWLAAGALALAVHLGIVAAFWESPVLPRPGGDSDGLRISLAPLGRGAPVSLAPAPDRAADTGKAAPAQAPARNGANERRVGAAVPLPDPAVAPADRPDPAPPVDPAAASTPDPLPAAVESDTAAPPAPRPRPPHLVRADPAPAAQAVPQQPSGGRHGQAQPARSPISGLPLARTPVGHGAIGEDPAGGTAAGPDPRATDTAGPAGAGTLLEGYLLRLQGIMQRNRRYPEAALAQRRHGVVMLGFSLHRSGRLLGGRVVRSSGHDLLDREAMDLLQRVTPLPPFPPGVDVDLLDLEVPIRFDRPGASGR